MNIFTAICPVHGMYLIEYGCGRCKAAIQERAKLAAREKYNHIDFDGFRNVSPYGVPALLQKLSRRSPTDAGLRYFHSSRPACMAQFA